MNIIEKANEFETLVKRSKLNLEAIKQSAIVNKLLKKYADEPSKTSLIDKYSTEK